MHTVPLDRHRHARHRFDCGVEPLNRYLKIMAAQQSSRDNSRTYVLESPDDPAKIIGYYTLTMTTIDLDALPSSLRKKHHHQTTAGLIARLAVDKHYTGRGLGAWLLVDALIRLLSASDAVGFPMVIVDAKEGVKGFYEQYGFRTFRDHPDRLYRTIADIRLDAKKATQ